MGGRPGAAPGDDLRPRGRLPVTAAGHHRLGARSADDGVGHYRHHLADRPCREIVVTESGSTVPSAIKAVAPTANIQLFDTDAECLEALEQGRADAYVLRSEVLAGDAVRNSGWRPGWPASIR